jgi:hypothetical protein
MNGGLGPFAAVIAYVHSDTMVNLAVFDGNGVAHSRTSVELAQDGGRKISIGEMHCEWMPYQTGQAAKTEKLQAELDAKSPPKGG